MFLPQKVVLIVVHNDVTMKSKLKRKQFIDSTLSVVALRNISSACERHSYAGVEKVHVHVLEQTTWTIIFPGYDIDSGIGLAPVMDRPEVLDQFQLRVLQRYMMALIFL